MYSKIIFKPKRWLCKNTYVLSEDNHYLFSPLSSHQIKRAKSDVTVAKETKASRLCLCWDGSQLAVAKSKSDRAKKLCCCCLAGTKVQGTYEVQGDLRGEQSVSILPGPTQGKNMLNDG